MAPTPTPPSGSIQEAAGPMAKCQYCQHTVWGTGQWHDPCRIEALKRDLAAALELVQEVLDGSWEWHDWRKRALAAQGKG